MIKEINNLESLTELQVISLIDNQIKRIENLHFLEKLKKVAIGNSRNIQLATPSRRRLAKWKSGPSGTSSRLTSSSDSFPL